jgi:hypothetical protein
VTTPEQNDARPPEGPPPPESPETRPQPAPREPSSTPREDGADTSVAVLLAIAAVIVAVVGGRAALIGDQGSDTWHQSVREDVKQAAGVVEDVRYLYQEEVPLALQVEQARIRERGFERSAKGESGTVREVLEARSKAQRQVAKPVRKSSVITSDPRYSPDERGVLRRLADARAKYPALVRLDPAATERRGSALSLESSLLTATTILAALAFLLGALAEGFDSWRRRLVPAGYTLAAMALVSAVVVEVSL